MDAWNVLRALKAGEISVDEAKKQLTQAPDPALSPASPATSRDLGEHYGLVLSTVHHLDELSWREWVVPEPGADEVTIRVHASAINFPDTMCVHGLYPTMPAYPFVPGFEVAGIVARVRRRDAGFQEGDEVIALTGPLLGGHASQVNVPLANVVHKPVHIAFEDACSLPVVFSTVNYAFAKAGLAPGEHVLIQTATGGCGLIALQLAHLKGCTCYGTSSRAEKLALLKRLGVAHAVNYKATEFDREIRRLTDNRGVDVVLNMLSGDGIQRGLNCLAPSGRYLEIAVYALKASKPLDLSTLVRNQTIHSIDLRQPGVHQGFAARDMLHTMVALLREERIVPIVSRVYPVHQIKEALAYVGEGRHIGKVVISHTSEAMVDRTEHCIQRLVQQKQRADAALAHAPTVVSTTDHEAARGEDTRLKGIAIIGMAGQFPMAPTVADFWDNVAQGRDCISEIPPSRWPLDLFYNPDPKAPGKTYGKWMGVLENIDKFDPLFFSISPAEAELMDPQQRLFLENCWHCLEDAGVNPAALSGQPCGVFVGCAPSDYGQFTGIGGMNAQGLLGGATSILSARISYLLNLKGPCLSIDTACSSSLVAIAEACNSLILRDCDLALAGGVWTMPGPGAHIMTSKAGMLSKDGRCFTFDQRANGFVPGEGVGVVLLKRLPDAVRDRDPIYGVIRGWGVNQDGKTNGITAPSVTSQISLETEVYRRFGIDPSTISLVEAHGTGTKLGDPIEVEALTESFRAFTREQQFCALGSVKSNIGHLFAAAGVSGVIKVLMALQHKLLPPTINFATLNEHINLEDSPFYINTTLKPWPGALHRAAVSTFGFSGTNAHIVIEEFLQDPQTPVSYTEPNQPVLFLLSARTQERLAAYAALMQDCIRARPELNLVDIAYTLQVGRTAMDHRLAIYADSRQTLLDGLAAFTAGRPAERLLIGTVRKSKGGTGLLDGVADRQAALQSWCEALASGDAKTVARETKRLAGLWVQGLEVEWHRLYDAVRASGDRAPRRISLPGYPFAKEHCWIPDVSHLQAPRAGATSFLHPLVHRNTSTFFAQRFSSTFSGEEFFLADHVINGRRFLPGIVALEMATAALVLASGEVPSTASQPLLRLTDVVWLRPIIAGAEPVEVHLRLLPDANGLAAFEVYSEVDGEAVVHSQGTVVCLAEPEMESAPRLDLPALQAQCNCGRLSGAQCYQAFRAMHMAYGPGHQGIDTLYLGAQDGAVWVLAKLTLPEHLRADLDRFTLHPCLLDSALQASIGLSGLGSLSPQERGGEGPRGSWDKALHPNPLPGGERKEVETTSTPAPALPFAVERVDILGPCTPIMWALLREASLAGGIRKLDIDLCDEGGEVRVRIRGYASRVLTAGGEGQAGESWDSASVTEPPARYHPLIDADMSSAGERVFAKCFSNRDSILRDHVFDGVCILPAAAIIEMACEAVTRTGVQLVQLTNFLVGYPIVGTEQGIDTRLVLKPQGEHIDFSLTSHDTQSGQNLIHSQGTMATGERRDNGDAGVLELGTIRARLPHRANLEHGYDTVVPHAVEFGPTLRTLCEFHYGEGEALAKIVVGEESRGDDFVLHPLIIDGVFQAGAVAYYYRRQGFQPSVLFSIDRLEIFAPTGDTCYAHLNLLDSGHGNTMAFDATVCNEAGRIVAHLTRVTIKIVTQPGPAAQKEARAGEGHVAHTDLFQKTVTYLKEAIAKVVKIPAERIDIYEDFGKYGIDSLTIMSLNDLLGKDFHALQRTLFFEYITVQDLATYFVTHHTARLQQLLHRPAVHQPVPPPAGLATRPRQSLRFARPVSGSTSAGDQEGLRPAPTQSRQRSATDTQLHEVAIIGLAGRYPGAEQLEQFWENLQLGRDCVTEIPPEAWDYRAMYDPERQRENAIYCKWGGFVNDADKFDPLFFHISPLEAETLDPQARIFLETAWHCVEDAGYAPRSFAAMFSNRNVGVFVGVSTNEYQLLKLPSADIDLNGVAYLFSVANRVSYHLDLHGPSISVDTACSSSLSAIHMACKSIMHGECEAAIAGGVTLSLHPHKYQYLSKGNFLASDGRCRSFGAGGDGYVPGEGVGAVLLKPLHQAVQDGDHIYGVIKSSAINHGGKTSGFTVPNPRAQAQLIQNALCAAGVDPRTINYVEAHGTGTELGDPIEMAGLAEAFYGTTADGQFCAIGSCKSNIGHLEAAAGIAQLTKVLLQMQHRQLVPSIHTRELNPNINFASTPFYVQRELSTWEPAMLERDGKTHTYPRRAGISSFGVGGANAHLIVEEYEPPRKPRTVASREPRLLVLSAANEERLRVYAGAMAAFLSHTSSRDVDVPAGEIQRDLVAMVRDVLAVPAEEIDADVELGDLGFDATTLTAFTERLNESYGLQLNTTLYLEYPTIAALAGYLVQHQHGLDSSRSGGLSALSPRERAGGEGKENEVDLCDLAYTLQTGREPLEERLAVIVSGMVEAVDMLSRFHAGERTIAGLYRGNARKDKAGLPASDASAVADLLHNRALTELARLWVAGLEVHWRPLYGAEQPARLSLPTYPFARERYWLPQGRAKTPCADTVAPGEQASRREDVEAVQALHPLLQRNTSDFSAQRFSSSFTAREFFLADHRIHGQRMLPAVAYLEMARAAVVLAHGGLVTGVRLRHVVWARPFVALEEQDGPVQTGSAGPKQLHIGLSLEENGTISYEIYGDPEQPDDAPPVYGQGFALVDAQSNRVEAPALDLTTLRRQCHRRSISADACYQAFKAVGIDYGPGHRGITALYVGSDRVLARLRLPAAVADTRDRFVLHPSLLDGALQSAIGLLDATESGDPDQTGTGPGTRPALPFALEELELFAPCTPDMWALVRYSDGSGTSDTLQKLDIDLCDDHGSLCVSLRGLACRVFSATRPAGPNLGTLLMAPAWRESAQHEAPSGPSFSQHLVICCEPDGLSRQALQSRLAGVDMTCLISDVPEDGIATRFQAHLKRIFEDVQAVLQSRPVNPVLVQVVVPGRVEEQRLLAAVSSLLKTAHLENPNFVGQLIEVRDDFTTWCDGLAGTLQENRARCRDSHVLYRDGKRLVATWEQLAVLPSEAVQEALTVPWQDDGVYLITGGVGGLGQLFAEEIARRASRVNLILVGRSPLADEPHDRLAGLRARFPQATIDYRQVDVTHAAAVTELVQWIQRQFGRLHGIIHCAGVLRDNFLLKKSSDELRAVLAPKVVGLVHLDDASRDCDLDYLVLCSSGAAAEGNVGQADYAAANAFMDAYAAYRNHLADTGQRSGRTLAVNWPLWQDGGMRVDQQTDDLLRRMGLVPMTTEAGFRALYWGLASGRDQVWVLEGDLDRLQALFEPGARTEPPTASTALVSAEDSFAGMAPASERTRDKAVTFFRALLASAIKLPIDRIEADVPLEHYGIDSILIVQLTRQLEKVFGSLSKTLFFEYQNIAQLTDYFLKAHTAKLQDLLGVQPPAPVARAATPARPQPVLPTTGVTPAGVRQRRRFAPLLVAARQEAVAARVDGPADIAIIGLAGRYPMADNIEAFWANLKDGRDCITEIPPERWNHAAYFDEDYNKPGKTYSRWGGFLNGVDCFDPLFFNISPRQAEMMDPQERLFLECVYEAIEDAGYTRASLAANASPRHPGAPAPVGVYVGVMYEEYQLYGAQAQARGRSIVLLGSPSSIANRVSYFFNFNGPSLAVDTMCSSSLTTIHLACESLKRGECKLAIAGGVNVSIHPNKYLLLGQGRFVSSQGRCASFGAGGDGYVPGEGVGAVLLKPLAAAVADGDQIYGVIKGSAINHGGKTNGYSVPNPHAQAEVIGEVFRRAGINPRTVSYLEAHGTGTSLGDPIEITALTRAFRSYTGDTQFCTIGSVKSNIGHCESAAGIAGITKVLLQLKHRCLVPSLHSGTLNPNIDFANSPFTVSQALLEWQRPVVATGADAGREYPRIAGVSSFGAGGSNAHVMIEEYATDVPVMVNRSGAPALIPLSAPNEERLMHVVANLHRYLTGQSRPDLDLAALAYTLQVGREAMEERLALIVSSREELADKLAAVLAGCQNAPDLYRGTVGGLGRAAKDTVTLFAADEDLQTAVDTWIAKGKYEQLLSLWVQGLTFDWQRLYGADKPHGTPPRRISLPTYPFDRQRYWVPDLESCDVPQATEALPLLPPRNASDLADSAVSRPAPVTRQQLLDSTISYFQDLLAAVLKISANQIKPDVPMEAFGIDSVMVMQLTNHLEQTFGPLSKTLFFEYQNIHALSAYFVTAHGDTLAAMFAATNDTPATPPRVLDRRQGAATRRLDVLEHDVEQDHAEVRTTGPLDIAIIGLAGRYPGANNMVQFWHNLRGGKDCITDIPEDRWNYARSFDEATGTPGKTVGQWWGGFLDGVDLFDPLFFNISPVEAEYMDPQERLFLECVYAAIEDAGYTRASLAASASPRHPGTPAPVGVYVGVMYEEYQLYGALEQAKGKPIALSGMSAAIANRVSYFCNFQGPSLAVNTMCSSSLTAIHLACQSLKLGECELAIAGGVNVSIHPNKYVGLGQGKFLSSQGRCQAFGQGGDGYVPGEGVGAVVLKPLAQAIASGDHIYGIIKASAVNHGAKSNGYTVPNPTAQANVIGRAFEQAGIDPRTLSYLEAHGTGTALGDPIEITGLTKAMRVYTEDQHFCAIGSVKSNIGHGEGAAGIASLTKVLLQLKHRQLVPSLHAETLNPNIDFVDSPFVVQRELAAWQPPVIASGSHVREYPRLAGISSFGAGGLNAHLIVEEYIPEEREHHRIGESAGAVPAPALLVLSAKNQERLQEQARQLLAFVTDTTVSELNLADVAYTLQVGREAMPHRLALSATSHEELVHKLSAYLRGDSLDGLFLGRAADQHGGATHQRNRETGEAYATADGATADTCLARGAFAELLALWVQGVDVDWHRLYGGEAALPHRISLPTYPFARQRYWVPGIDAGTEGRGGILAASADHDRHTADRGSRGVPLVPALHPMLHRNTSTLAAQRFSTTFTGREFFLADHVVQGRPVLPAVAYLEMARVAAVLAMDAGQERNAIAGVRLRNVVWEQPMMLGEGEAGPVQVHLSLFPEDDGRLDYEIASESETGASVVHSRGCVVTGAFAHTPHLDLAAIQAQCSYSELSAAQCYQAFRAMGLDYGPAHRAIATLYVGSGQALAKLLLPADLADSQLVLHPSIVDAALQATIGLTHGSAGSAASGLALPFALDELEVYGACTVTMWAFIRGSADAKAGGGVRKLDIDVCNETGAVRVRMQGFSFRVLAPVLSPPAGEVLLAERGFSSFSPREKVGGEGLQHLVQASHPLPGGEGKEGADALMLEPYWQERDISEEAAAPVYAHHLTILCELGPEWDSPQNSAGGEPTTAVGSSTDSRRYLSLHVNEDHIAQRFHTYAVRVFEEIRRILASKPRGKVLIQLALPNQGERRLCVGLAGLLKTATLENPNLISQVLEVDEHAANPAAILWANAQCPFDQQVCYRDGKRLVTTWREVETDITPGRASHLPWRDRGVYLITGGAGGLGLIFAEEIVQRARDVTVILAGRSAPNEHTRILLEALTAMGFPGTRVEYRRLDVGQCEAVERLISDITDTFGGLHGILHSAGVTRDSFMLKKDPREFAEVLAPKVAGCVNLDQASRDLDFFVLFSSLAGAAGNPGQADYAAANAFLDAYAHYRNTLVRDNQRSGRTLSINWPLWREGGMRVDPSTEKIMQQSTGLVPMATSTGLAAFYKGLALGADQVMVLEGDTAQLRRLFGLTPSTGKQAASPVTYDEGARSDEPFYQRLLERILNGELSAEQVEKLLLASE